MWRLLLKREAIGWGLSDHLHDTIKETDNETLSRWRDKKTQPFHKVGK